MPSSHSNTTRNYSFANWLANGYNPNSPTSIPFGMTLEDYISPVAFQSSGTVSPALFNPLISQEQYHNLQNAVSANLITNSDSVAQPSTSAVGAFSNNGSVSTPYIDAPLASQYGMNRQTAYQEALANTAHQREIEDLKKAGLNPVLGYSGNGSAVFAGQVSGSGSGSGDTTDNFDSFASLLGAAATLVTGKSSVGKATSQMLSSAKHLLFG